MDSANIPLGQEFKVHIVATERYHNVVCMPEYEGFSPEVRYFGLMPLFALTGLSGGIGTSMLRLFTGKCYISSSNHDGSVQRLC